jgi:hypothetical protein
MNPLPSGCFSDAAYRFLHGRLAGAWRRRLFAILPVLVLAGCSQAVDENSSRLNLANRLDPMAAVQNATMSNEAIRLNPALLQPGVAREQIVAAFGQPNAVQSDGGRQADVYAFNADGSKFVQPQTYARNAAAGVATHGIATIVRQTRIHLTEEQVTYYLLTYGPDDKVQSVRRQ